MPDYVIETQKLSKTYKGVHALKNLDLKVGRNSIFGFLGPNGAGKTTTMKLLLGLIWPSGGEGSIFGLDIRRDSVEIRSRIGYLPQDPRFYEFMKVSDTLDFTARFYFKGPNVEIKKRVASTLELVGLTELSARKVGTLSGGERQRLGIAQAQVNYPDLIILDEPAASLDPLGRRDVLEVMARLRKHATIFYSTHILDDVQQVSDTVAILNKGELVSYGSIQELLAGSSGVIYKVVLEGAGRLSILDSLKRIPWVTEVQTTENDEISTLLISVSDENSAKVELLPWLIGQDNVLILEFGRKRYELEEIFMNIIEGGGYVRK